MNQQKLLNSPVQQEYVKRPPKRVYKECNRYKISNITLENYGLKIKNIDHGKRWPLPTVWSNDIINANVVNIIIGKKTYSPLKDT